MRSIRLLCIAILAMLSGCQHIADLQACRPPPKMPSLMTEHGGWDKLEIDDVRCSNDELYAVRQQRLRAESIDVSISIESIDGHRIGPTVK